MNYVNFEKKQVDVKQHLRKGKLVRATKRIIKNNKRKKAIKSIVIVAGILGLGAGTYIGMRGRYIHNLNKFADNLKANPDLGKTLSGKTMTFTMAGFVGKGETLNGSKRIAVHFQNQLSANQQKIHDFIPLEHNFTPFFKYKDHAGKKKALEFFGNSFKQLGNSFAKGKNKEAQNLAEVVYSYAAKNPEKPIHLIGHSGGSALAREVQYILNRKKLNVKLVTMAAPDFSLLPRDLKMERNFVSNNDFVKPVAPRGSIFFDVASGEDGHRQPGYFKSSVVNKGVIDFLFSN